MGLSKKFWESDIEVLGWLKAFSIEVGDDDVLQGIVNIYGAATSDGGDLRIYNAADQDTFDDYFSINANTTGEFIIAGSITGEFFRYNPTTDIVTFAQGEINVGITDSLRGLVNIYGEATIIGGRINLHNPGDGDTDDEYYNLNASSGIFTITGTTTGNFLTYNSSTKNLDFAADTIQISTYGEGTITGTPAYNIVVDASGNIIETALPSGTSPLTTKGDLYTYDTGDQRLAIGTTDGWVLTVDVASGTGMKWAAPTGGGGFTKAVNQTTHGFAVDDAIRHNGTIWVKAQADTAANAGTLGVVTVVAGANDFTYQFGGLLTTGTWTDGAEYFLSAATAGLIIVEPSYSIGEVREFIGTGTPDGMLLEIDLGDVIEAAGGGGDIATDDLWAAAGDLVVGTGVDTAAILSIGTTLQYLRVNAGVTNLEWATLPTAGATQLSGLSDVTSATQTAGFILASSGGNYAGRALINSDLPNTIIVGDHGTGTTDEVINVCYGTSATPPTASGTTEGTLYLQHEA